MERVRFNIGGYDDLKVFDGFDAGRWNGWLIPAVTKEVWEDVIAWQKSLLTDLEKRYCDEEGLEEIIEDLESVEPNQEGLYLIGCGLVWDIVEDDKTDQVFVLRNHNGRFLGKFATESDALEEKRFYEDETGNFADMSIESQPVPDFLD